ncbi:MAG: hypothetical protein QE271_10245 [Bacteriovoracaceae bacterium]|nr:hypothetical protein [Bacteriovoracaceae bacterium]
MTEIIDSKVTAKTKTKPNNPFIELIFNVVIPTFIMTKGTKYLGNPTISLLVALCFPLGFLLFDLAKNKKWNFFAIIGLCSILLTGGLALFKVPYDWYPWKEALVPLLIGIFVLYSSFTVKPLIHMILFNPAMMDTEKLEVLMNDASMKQKIDHHLKISTIYFSLSFFLSSLLNYVLAVRVFVAIPSDLTTAIQEQMLNDQIAEMHIKSNLVIVLPCMVATVLVLIYLFYGLKKISGLGMNELMRTK